MANEDAECDDWVRAEHELLIRETLDRRPPPYPKLLMWLSHDERDAFVRLDFITSRAYVDAYSEAAVELSRHAPRDVGIDSAAIAIVYLYRHFVELALKWCIIALGAHIHRTTFRSDFMSRPNMIFRTS